MFSVFHQYENVLSYHYIVTHTSLLNISGILYPHEAGTKFNQSKKENLKTSIYFEISGIHKQ